MVLAVIFAVVGAFYYLRVVKLMYFDEPVDDSLSGPLPVYRKGVIWVLSGNALLLIAVTPWIGHVVGWINAAF